MICTEIQESSLNPQLKFKYISLVSFNLNFAPKLPALAII